VEHPLQVERYELIDDSGGPGTWRGGLGIHRRVRVVGHEARVGVNSTRRLSAPWGLFGGHEGGKSQITVSDGAASFSRGSGLLRPGEAVSIVTPGAGGYGDPHQRARELVERDLREGKISETVARDVYGLPAS
jgi:N-methylhydantoinase B